MFNPALQEIVSILNKVFNAPHQEIRKALGRIFLKQFRWKTLLNVYRKLIDDIPVKDYELFLS